MDVAVESALEPEEKVCWRTWYRTVKRDTLLTGSREVFLSSYRQHKHYLQELKSSFK